MVARARLTTILSDQDSGVKWACVATKDFELPEKTAQSITQDSFDYWNLPQMRVFFSFEKRQEICLLIILLLERKTQVPIYRKKKEDRKTKQV